MRFTWSGGSKTQTIRQASNTECGLACIGMVASFYGMQRSLSELRREFDVSLRGSTLSDLVEISSTLGFLARGIKCEPEDLNQLRLPAIIHWNLNHFVVLNKVLQNGKYEILDPARGKQIYSSSKLANHFTGIALELVPTKNFKKSKRENVIRFGDLIYWNKTLIKPTCQALILSAFLQIFILISPFFMQLVIDEAIFKGDANLLLAICAGFATLKILETTTAIFRRILFQLIGKVVTFDLRSSLFHHLIRLPIPYFWGRGTGDILQRFESLYAISRFLVSGVLEAVVDITLLLIVGYILFSYDAGLAVIATVFILGYFFSRLLFLKFSMRLETDHEEAMSRDANRFLETVSSIQTIKTSGIELERETIWRGRAAEAINTGIKVGNVRIAFDLLGEMIKGLSLILIVYLGATSVINNELTLGMLIAFLAYKSLFENSLIALLNKWVEFKMLDVHLKRIADIALAEPEEPAGSSLTAKSFEGGIELKNVSFRYSKTEPYIFENLNLKIEKGEFVALTGPSGGGKSTLLKLLVGIYAPTGGEIYYDGQSLDSWGIKSLRKQMGVVMQDDRLLAGSISENICLFEATPDFDRIEWSARTAQILDEINDMPMGLNTVVGDIGIVLSGGQIQRIMIARALYRNPSLLLFDEGTSHLDLSSERKINESLKMLAVTRVFAAHRPDTIRKADRILLVENRDVSSVEYFKNL